MRRALCALLLLAACHGELEDRIYVYGRATSFDGGALALQPLTLFELVWDTPPQVVATDTTDDEGRYFFTLYRFQLTDLNGYSREFSIRIDGPNGAASEAWFNGIPFDRALPDLVLWDGAGAQVLDQPGGLAVTTPEFPLPPFEDWAWPTAGGMYLRSYEWELGPSESEVAWIEPALDGGWSRTLPREVLEDIQSPSARLVMTTRTAAPRDPVLGVMPDFMTRSIGPSLPLQDGPGPPLSRDKPCWVVGVPKVPCPTSDGLFTIRPGQDPWTYRFPLVSSYDVDVGWNVSEVWRVDLEAAVTPTLMIVRNPDLYFPPSLDIEGSADGGSWELLGVLEDDAQVVQLATPSAPVRYVRLNAHDAGVQWGASEISIY